MIKIRTFLLVIFVCLLLNGCGKEPAPERIPEPTTTTTSTTETLYEQLLEGREFLIGDSIPLLRNNNHVGTVKINAIFKVMISDWYNEKAKENKVDYSYSINLNVKMDRIKEPMVLHCEPIALSSTGKPASSVCNVGWSGFPSDAQLYDQTKSVNIEVGFQPEYRLKNGSKLQLCFTDDNGSVYQPITLASSIFDEVKEVGQLITSGDYVVKSFNGAEYSLNVDQVYYENQFSNEDAETEDLYYSFRYSTKYLKKRTNQKKVFQYDEFDGNTLNPKLVVGVQSDVDSVLLYEENQNALRYSYGDTTDTALYVTNDISNIRVGGISKIVTNRKIPVTTTIRPKYLRIRFEFSDELKSYSLKEKLKSNTRYVVFQEKIGNRRLKKKSY